MVIGYIRLDRPGDLSPEETECAECGQDCLRGAWVAVMVTEDGLALYGPLCEACAESE